MPKLSFSRSVPRHPHAATVCMWAPHLPRLLSESSATRRPRLPAAVPPPGTGNSRLQNFYFHLDILTYLGRDFCFEFPLKGLHFHLNKNQTERKGRRAENISAPKLPESLATSCRGQGTRQTVNIKPPTLDHMGAKSKNINTSSIIFRNFANWQWISFLPETSLCCKAILIFKIISVEQDQSGRFSSDLPLRRKMSTRQKSQDP